jgi:hypothetical protein
MSTAKSKFVVPFKPGAKAAARRARVSEYTPQYQLWCGHDPWLEHPADLEAADFAGLLPEDLRDLGLSVHQMLPISS